MVMVNQPALRRHHRSRIAYVCGLLALLGAMVTVLVLARDPAMSSTRLTTPVPAPEITVVDDHPPTDDDPPAAEESDWLSADARGNRAGVTEPTGSVTGGGAGGEQQQQLSEAAPAGNTATDTRRSLFWSGIFGLAISLAGLGLVGTRRRLW
ncbi:hypothetical protein ACGFH8_08120 [Micromonospora sp. NPDC049175]|uniref:hypothetical protein n=1 Tax=Micromonospora sp. NPDC049175 TaxID=3364266 RepID=UPI003718549F